MRRTRKGCWPRRTNVYSRVNAREKIASHCRATGGIYMRSVCGRGHQPFARNLALRSNAKGEGHAARHDSAAEFQTVHDAGLVVGGFAPDWRGKKCVETSSGFSFVSGFD